MTDEDKVLYDREMTYHEDDLGGSRGTITCLWKGEDRYVGWSRCHSDMDQFNRKIGRKIAFGRALHALKEANNLVSESRKYDQRENYDRCWDKIYINDPVVHICSDCGIVLYTLPEFLYRQVKPVESKKES